MLRRRSKLNEDEVLELAQRMRDLLQEALELYDDGQAGRRGDLSRRIREALLDFHLASGKGVR